MPPSPRSPAIRKSGITVHDMRVIDEHGVAVLVRTFIERVRADGIERILL